jgi:predicted alpha/beta-hydrolase family hydrolase
MARRREDGKRRPPDRQPVLLEPWRAVVSSTTSANVAIGGKSMGGRMASLIADEVGAAGLVCLGYPFHPPGKPDRLRTEHLAALKTPTLILQGERDPFGTKAEVDGYDLARSIEVQWLGDGNHDLAPRKKSGRTHEENLKEAIAGIVGFLSD